MHWIVWPLLLLLVALLFASRTWIWLKAGLLTLLLMALSSWWLIDQLSGDGINAATLYHLGADMEGAGIADFRGLIARYVGLLLLSLSPLLLVRWRKRAPLQGHGRSVFAGFAAAFVAVVLLSPLYGDALRIYHQTRPVDYAMVAPEYSVPDKPLHAPRNIVWIYGESLERTYFNKEAFPDLMPNLQGLAAQGLDVRGLRSADGSGWTIAGLVASMCGVPLTTSRGDENSMDRMGRFLPEAVCLGDYLKQQGYSNHYLGGANGQFAGKSQFLASHGFDGVHDQAWFRDQKVASRHFSPWGVHDDVLLDSAFDRFMQLSKAGKPFMLTTLTMDTHHPAGHLPIACQGERYESTHGNIGLLNAIKCSDRLISQLVQRIRDSRYGEDTLIVIASDHLAMPNDISHVLADLPRENLLLFLGKDVPVREVTVDAGSTLDSGATLLSLLDPAIDRIGFGRSLLAPDTAPSASAAAVRDHGRDYPRYLAFARSLWLGGQTRVLQIDEDDNVRLGMQQVRPPLLLEYDESLQLKSVYLENTSRQFESADPDSTLAYVDRCTAFEDGNADGDWCALLVNRERGIKLFRDAELKQGLPIDSPLDTFQGPRPAIRQAHVLTHRAQKTHPGQYVLEMYARQLPQRPFWVEAVSSQRRVVLAQQWVQPDADGRISLPLGLDHEVDDLEVRVWLNHAEKLAVDTLALIPSRQRPRG